MQFFDAFSKQHQGWIATVELIGSRLGDQEPSNRLPLVGITELVPRRGRPLSRGADGDLG